MTRRITLIWILGPIASMFWENETMSEAIYLDGVVCVVDALFGMKVSGSLTDVVFRSLSTVARSWMTQTTSLL